MFNDRTSWEHTVAAAAAAAAAAVAAAAYSVITLLPAPSSLY